MTQRDRIYIRELAKRVAAEAHLPVQSERRNLWRRHNALEPVRPMILVYPEGSWVELLGEADLQCEDAQARTIESALRRRLYYHEHLQDDTVIEADWVVNKVIRNSGWGLEIRRIPSPEKRGAWMFDPVIHEPEDLKKLRAPVVEHDEGETLQRLEFAQDLFGDILEVKLKGVDRISYHLMKEYSDWRGLEAMMMDMVLEPQMLHDAMGILEEGHHGVLRQYVEQNLLSLNNDATYHSSGGNGYTTELPAPGFDPACVRPCDMWGSAESQELARVGPEHHAEFALAYEKRLLEPFGLTGYGCCEALDDKMQDVLAIPQIRRISISPFADVDVCAQQLGNKAIFSWKPRPMDLVGAFDEEAVAQYIRHTIDVCAENGCVLEMILKDTHTCEGDRRKFEHWVRVARREVDAAEMSLV